MVRVKACWVLGLAASEENLASRVTKTAFKAAFDPGADQHIGDRRAARRFARDGDALRIAAEGLHVVVDPVERQDLIRQAAVGIKVLTAGIQDLGTGVHGILKLLIKRAVHIGLVHAVPECAKADVPDRGEARIGGLDCGFHLQGITGFLIVQCPECKRLRRLMREGTMNQSGPFLRHNAQDCYYAGLRAGEGLLFMGPMAHQRLSAAVRRQMYRACGIESDSMGALPVFTLPEIRNMVLLTNTVLENASLENEELLQLNRIINRDEQQLRREQTSFNMRENEADAVEYNAALCGHVEAKHLVKQGVTYDSSQVYWL